MYLFYHTSDKAVCPNRKAKDRVISGTSSVIRYRTADLCARLPIYLCKSRRVQRVSSPPDRRIGWSRARCVLHYVILYTQWYTEEHHFYSLQFLYITYILVVVVGGAVSGDTQNYFCLLRNILHWLHFFDFVFLNFSTFIII